MVGLSMHAGARSHAPAGFPCGDLQVTLTPVGRYIFSHYGDWLKSVAPVKITNPEALPEMRRYPGWDGFMQLWTARAAPLFTV